MRRFFQAAPLGGTGTSIGTRIGTSIGTKLTVGFGTLVGLTLLVVAFAILAVSKVRWEMMTSAILFGICFGLAYPAFATFILGNTDPLRRARTFGSMVWAFDTGLGTAGCVFFPDALAR